MSIQREHSHSILISSKSVKEELTQQAQGKRDGLANLQAYFEAVLSTVLDKLDGLKRVVQENIKSEQNPDGLLTRSEQDYIDCLELNYHEFQTLLVQDAAYWAENQDNVAVQSLQIDR